MKYQDVCNDKHGQAAAVKWKGFSHSRNVDLVGLGLYIR